MRLNSFFLTLVILLPACTLSEHSTSGSASGRLQGIWIPGNEANELRTTKQLKSMCPDVLTEPDAQVSNMRFIDGAGNIFVYAADANPQNVMKIGMIGRGGVLAPSTNLKDDMKNVTATFAVKGDTMTVKFIIGGKQTEWDYLRSSKGEGLAYRAALESCKTSATN